MRQPVLLRPPTRRLSRPSAQSRVLNRFREPTTLPTQVLTEHRAIPKTSEAVQVLMMRAGITVKVKADDRRRLEAIVSDRNATQKRVWRAKIILATADGCGTSEIMRRSGKAKPVVWRWQARFMAEGVEGLTRDKTRKPGKHRCRRPRCSGWSIWRSLRRREKPALDRPDAGEGGGREFAIGATHP